MQAISHRPRGGTILRKGRISQLVVRTLNCASGCKKGKFPHCSKSRAQHMMARALANRKIVLLITSYLKELVVVAFLLHGQHWLPRHQPQLLIADAGRILMWRQKWFPLWR